MNTVKPLEVFLQIKANVINSLLTGDPSEGVLILMKIVYIVLFGFYCCTCTCVYCATPPLIHSTSVCSQGLAACL